jgi:hypothetical protein
MTVLVVTFVDQAFDKKSAEIQYLARAIELFRNELTRSRGAVTTGTIIGQSATGVANTALGSWTYTPSATLP